MSKLVLAGLILVGAIAWCVLHPARAHDPYSNWRMPDNPSQSCCSNSAKGEEDCGPVSAEYVDGQGWRVRGAITGGHTLWIDPKKVMQKDLLQDGRAHWCGRNGVTYCFSPSEPRI